MAAVLLIVRGGNTGLRAESRREIHQLSDPDAGGHHLQRDDDDARHHHLPRRQVDRIFSCIKYNST